MLPLVLLGPRSIANLRPEKSMSGFQPSAAASMLAHAKRMACVAAAALPLSKSICLKSASCSSRKCARRARLLEKGISRLAYAAALVGEMFIVKKSRRRKEASALLFHRRRRAALASVAENASLAKATAKIKTWHRLSSCAKKCKILREMLRRHAGFKRREVAQAKLIAGAHHARYSSFWRYLLNARLLREHLKAKHPKA